jgi:hypothetical protein
MPPAPEITPVVAVPKFVVPLPSIVRRWPLLFTGVVTLNAPAELLV